MRYVELSQYLQGGVIVDDAVIVNAVVRELFRKRCHKAMKKVRYDLEDFECLLRVRGRAPEEGAKVHDLAG